MRDPFPSKIKNQLYREAQIGFCVVGALMVVLVYVLFYRLTGQGHQVPNVADNGSRPESVSVNPDTLEQTFSPQIDTAPPFTFQPATSSPTAGKPLEPNRFAASTEAFPVVINDQQIKLASGTGSDSFSSALPHAFSNPAAAPQQSPNAFQPAHPPSQPTIAEAIGAGSIPPIQPQNSRRSPSRLSQLDSHTPSTVPSRPIVQRDIALDAINHVESPKQREPVNSVPVLRPTIPPVPKPTISLPNPRIYVTQSGDTLWDIAGQELGQASLYSDIHRLNSLRLAPQTGHLSPLPVGLRLVLPAH